jgi:hypothetical protein
MLRSVMGSWIVGFCIATAAQAAPTRRKPPAPAIPAAPEPAPALAPAPAPVLTKPAPALPVDAPLIDALVEPPPEPPTFQVALKIGGGFNTEDETKSSAGLVRVGIAGDWEFAPNFRAAFSFASSFSSTTLFSPSPDGSPFTQATVAEQRYDVGLGVNYRFSFLNNRVDLEPGLAFRAGLFHNTLFPTNVGGLAPELLLRWRLASAFAVEVNGAYTYNLVFRAVPSSNPLGKPLGLGTWGLGGRYFLADGRQSLRLGYVGDVLTLDHTNRVFHSLEASYSVAF